MSNGTHTIPQDFPPPEPEAAAHSERLAARIKAAIERAGGRIPFDRYMQLALYEPGLGYYSAGQPRFGPGGDFITAPLVSTLYSRTLARQTAEVLDDLGGGAVIEFGAGTGRMAADVLAELIALDRLPAAYYIIEVSAALRQEQQRTLEHIAPEALERVAWLDQLPERPMRGVVLANEVLDALPVKRFQKASDCLLEVMVTRGNDGFEWSAAPADDTLRQAISAIEADVGEPLAAGYTSEWCPGLAPWMRSLAGILEAGAALLIDYGYPRREYYHPQRHMGTMMCHYRHRAHGDPLVLPGLQDITAYVDFSAAAAAGREAGLELLGFATQAHFLMGAGLPELIEEAHAGDPDAAVTLTQEAKTLIFPGEMGERFKVLGMGRGLSEPLGGFALFDHRGRLGAG
ncbi:MAG: SAM-dependent methyltransferase [Ectothiorhodospiraceae bacterium]|jgi:SAM-dependent MidA family methyltransferase